MPDVLVIGAGPGGSQTALQLARQGFSVTVVDRRHTIGEKLCSGIVGVECLRRFPANPSLLYRPASAGLLHSPSGATLRIARPEPQAYILDRVRYVADFAHQAQAAGASYLLGRDVRSLDFRPDGVTALFEGGESIHAQAVVLASGFGSPLTKLAGLGETPDYLIGIQQEVLAPRLIEIEVWLGRNVAPGSFAWLVPTCDGHAHLGLLTRRQSALLLERLTARLQQEGLISRVTTSAARWGIPIRPLPRTYGDRVLAVGDAAGQVKPATGGGIFYALLAAELAADTLAAALRKGDLSARGLASYEEGWRALLGNEIETTYTARRLFERLGDRQMEAIFNILSRNGLASRLLGEQGVSFDFHGGLLNQVLRLPGVQQTLRLLAVMGSPPAATEPLSQLV